jgi:hypothetical protein
MVLCDYLLWDTLDDARASAEMFAEMPEGRKLIECVDEIIVFDHFQPDTLGRT